MMASLKWYLDPLSPHQLNRKKNAVKVGPPLKTLSGSAHDSLRPRHELHVVQLIGQFESFYYNLYNCMPCSFNANEII